MLKISGCNWSDEFDPYVKCMTWGHNYGGELYWREEEEWLKAYFKDRNIETSLDIACGLFRECETLKTITKKRLIGLDYEQKFVDYLKDQNVETKFNPQVRVEQGDAQDLRFNDESFDLTIILFSSIGIIPDMGKALREMRRVTKKDGYMLLSFWQDTKEVTDFRIKTYINGKTFRTGEVVHNEKQGLDDITMKDNGTTIHLSAIIPKQYIIDFVKTNLPEAQLEFFENKYSRIVVIR